MPEVSFNIVSRWARTGQLRLGGKRAAPGDRIEAGQEIRVPPLEAAARARGAAAAEARAADRGRGAVRPRHGHLRGCRTRSCSTSRRGSRRRAGPRRTQHLDRLLDGLADERRPAQARPPARQGHVGRAAGRADARGRRGISPRPSPGRTARKVYWALVVGVPDADEGADRRAARQAAGHRRREDAHQRGARASGEDPLAGDRPRRQPRRLGRASAADRPHAPAARAHGGDRPSDRRRRQIWRARRRS